MHGWEVAVIALGIAACVGLLYMVAFIIIPKIMVYMAFVLSALALLTAGILMMVQPVKMLSLENSTWNIIIGIILIVVAILMAMFLFCQDREL
jgi:uncharacterized membrane protein HdeD (DUF308 family)